MNVPDEAKMLVEEAKKAGFEVKAVQLSGNKLFIYRGLTRKEWEEITADQNIDPQKVLDAKAEMERKIVSVGLIYPKLDEAAAGKLLAGTVTQLSDLIMAASGFDLGPPPEPVTL